VNSLDLLAVRRNLFSNAPVTSRFDFDRDGRVTAADYSLARSNYFRRLLNLTEPVPQAASSTARAGRLADELLD
jgi:hypothetical protein